MSTTEGAEDIEYSLLTCPADVIYVIVNYLAVRSIVKLTATCKHFANRINCPALMKSIMLRKNGKQILPAMQKLSLFTRLNNLVLGLQSENEKDIYQGLGCLTTLTQLQHLTLRIPLDHLDLLGKFFGSLNSLQTLNLRVVKQEFDSTINLDGLRHLSTKLHSLTMSISQYRNLEFLQHLPNLKYFVLMAPVLHQSDTNMILKLTKLTNLALSTGDVVHQSFFEQLGKLESLQVFVSECSSRVGYFINNVPDNQLRLICTSLPNLQMLIFNSKLPYQIPEQITKLEHLRVFRASCPWNEGSGCSILLKLPYLEVQTDSEETFEILMKTRQRLIEEIKLSRPDISDEDVTANLAKIRMVDKGLFPGDLERHDIYTYKN